MNGKHRKPPWWRRGRDREPQLNRPRWSLTEMVDGDGWAHLVTSDEFEASLRERTGRYVVVCGRCIAVASMVTPPTRPCRVLETGT
jgi:hypothetical protein